MACSRSLRVRAAVLAAVCALALLPASAHAAASLADREVEPVRIVSVGAAAFGIASEAVVDGADELAVPRFCPVALEATCDPAAIEAGIDCGMDWMCGIEPCLCGSADAWGGCSCNGLETLAPTTTYASSDEGVVRVVEAAGRMWLVPVGPGTATLTCTASLRHFDDAVAQVTMRVGGPTLTDAALMGSAAAAVAVAVAAGFGVRALVRKRKRNQEQKHTVDGADGAAKGE
ncbi:hypothetical protein [Eggerthella sinensis]|uniref:hypothetical protein n=1 Tax=Eggerthella sinensis TaxID=242230 RepID=UPI00248E7479|nr:hypothetical protein [Eggerthella sinensis]